MPGKCIDILYRLVVDADTQQEFRVRIDSTTLQHQVPAVEAPPEWTSLGNHRCTHCPLDRALNEHCPAALSLVSLMELSNELLSYTEVDAFVETPERTFSKRCSTQKALSSLVGLCMATSGCPSMSLLKPMARFHLPFATREETIYRAASSYLLAQFFLHRKGQTQDLELEEFQAAYDRIHEVNMSMASRLRSISLGDASINALVLLDLFAHSMPLAAEGKLGTLRYLYEDFLRSGADGGSAVDPPSSHANL